MRIGVRRRGMQLQTVQMLLHQAFVQTVWMLLHQAFVQSARMLLHQLLSQHWGQGSQHLRMQVQGRQNW